MNFVGFRIIDFWLEGCWFLYLYKIIRNILLGGGGFKEDYVEVDRYNRYCYRVNVRCWGLVRWSVVKVKR